MLQFIRPHLSRLQIKPQLVGDEFTASKASSKVVQFRVDLPPHTTRALDITIIWSNDKIPVIETGEPNLISRRVPSGSKDPVVMTNDRECNI